MLQRSPSRSAPLDDIGNPDAPTGSGAWAKWFTLQAKRCRKELDTEASELAKLLAKLKEGEAWKPLGLASFSMLCLMEIGLTMEQAEAILAAKPGETIGAALGLYPGPDPGSMTLAARAARESAPNGSDRTNRCKRGDNSAYYTALLDRDHPEIAARLRAGEFSSVRAAAREAGLIESTFRCPEDPVKAAKRLKGHFQDERLALLLAELVKEGT